MLLHQVAGLFKAEDERRLRLGSHMADDTKKCGNHF
jgi:hypothetical protein